MFGIGSSLHGTWNLTRRSRATARALLCTPAAPELIIEVEGDEGACEYGCARTREGREARVGRA